MHDRSVEELFHLVDHEVEVVVVEGVAQWQQHAALHHLVGVREPVGRDAHLDPASIGWRVTLPVQMVRVSMPRPSRNSCRSARSNPASGVDHQRVAEPRGLELGQLPGQHEPIAVAGEELA